MINAYSAQEKVKVEKYKRATEYISKHQKFFDKVQLDIINAIGDKGNRKVPTSLKVKLDNLDYNDLYFVFETYGYKIIETSSMFEIIISWED